MTNKELMDAIGNNESESIDAAPKQLPKKTVNTMVKTTTVAIVSGLVCGVLAFTVGGFLGRSGAVAEMQASAPQNVVEIKAKTDVFSQLQDMRENNIKSLQKQIAQLSASETAKSSAQSNIVADFQTIKSTTKQAEAVISALIKADVNGDDMTDYQNEGVKAAISAMGDNVAKNSTDNSVVTVFAGSSPYKQLGKHCEAVSASTVSVVDVTSAQGSSSAIESVTYLFVTPIADADGTLHNAEFVVVADKSGTLQKVAYVGLLDAQNPVDFSKILAEK